MPRASRTFREAKTDAQLLALARAGDADAFDAIVDRYRPRLIRYCTRLTRPERVDDAVQQTFLNAWLALERGVAVRELRPWLFSVARNAAIDQLRLHRPDQVELSADLVGGADPAAVSAARGEIDDVLRAVADLPERQRTALLETSVHGRPTEQVADEMGMTGGALRQLVHRARTSVRGAVASFLPGPVAGWLTQTGGEEGTRRLTMLLTGAGQSATATALAATATVASVGAISTGGIESLRVPEREEASVGSSAGGESDDAGRGDRQAGASSRASALAARAIITLPAASATSRAAAQASAAASGIERGTAADGDAAASEPARSRSRSSSADPERQRRAAGGSDREHDDGPEPRSGAGSSADGGESTNERAVAHRPSALGASRRAGGSRGGGAWCDPADSTDRPTPAADAGAQPAPASSPAPEPSPAPSPTESTPVSAGEGQSGEPGGEGTAGSESSMSSS